MDWLWDVRGKEAKDNTFFFSCKWNNGVTICLCLVRLKKDLCQGKHRNSISDMLNLKCLLDIQEGDVGWITGQSRLESWQEVQVRDAGGGIIRDRWHGKS